MDDFLKDIHREVFKKWIIYQLQHYSHFSYEIIDPNTYSIYYNNKIGQFVIWDVGIIEESIYEGETLLFYLHYELNHLHLAVDYFYRMIEQIKTASFKQNIHVLLCCSGGMTTGFFAEKLNNYCQLNHIHVEVSATAVYHLPNVYQDYDMILVAPQLRYQVIELSQKYQPTVVQSIDPVVFATYDCPALLNQIEHIKEKFHE